MWVDFAKGHLKKLKLKDRNGFTEYARSHVSCYSVSKDAIISMFDEVQDELAMEPLDPAPHHHHPHPSSSGPALEVATASLEKGQKKVDAREKRRLTGK